MRGRRRLSDDTVDVVLGLGGLLLAVVLCLAGLVGALFGLRFIAIELGRLFGVDGLGFFIAGVVLLVAGINYVIWKH